MKRLTLLSLLSITLLFATPIEWTAHTQEVKRVDGLVWQDMPVNKKKMLSWKKAKEYCKRLEINYHGFMLDDFRLPSVKEAKALKGKLERFRYKQYFNYWTNKTFVRRKKSYAKYMSYNRNWNIQEYPANFGQQFRCVQKDRLVIQENMSLESIAQKIASIERKNEAKAKTLPKPTKPSHIKPKPLQKGEFEKSKEFTKRVAKEKARVARVNDKLDVKYADALQAWQAASKKADKTYEMQNSKNAQAKQQALAMSEAMSFKYGSPLVASAVYDADKELFHVVVMSSKAKKRAKVKSKNLLDAPVLSKDGIFSVERVEHISQGTTRVWLKFHKRPANREVFLGHYKQIEITHSNGKRYKRKEYKDNYSVRQGDIVKIDVPRVLDTVYYPAFGYLLGKKKIRLNKEANPVYVLTMQVPVKIAYAKKFKALLLSEDFQPTVEFEMREGRFIPLGIKEIKDPETLVVENAYKKAQGNIEALEAFVTKYKEHSLAGKAKKELDILKEAHKKAAEKQAKKQKEAEEKQAQKDKERYEAYHAPKHIGEKVCMEGKMLLFMSVKVSAYVEAIEANKIQLRIADTEGQNPNYNGVTLKQDTIIWDDANAWRGCE